MVTHRQGHDANARLIAAAPQMYEALEAAERLLKNYDRGHLQVAASAECELVIAALAAARGDG